MEVRTDTDGVIIELVTVASKVVLARFAGLAAGVTFVAWTVTDCKQDYDSAPAQLSQPVHP